MPSGWAREEIFQTFGQPRSWWRGAGVSLKGGEALMVAERSMPWDKKRFWFAGEYTLLADFFTTEAGVTYSKGDTVRLDDQQATRLGHAGSISAPDGMQAVRARVEGGRGSRRDKYLCQMWELAGAWEESGRP